MRETDFIGKNEEKWKRYERSLDRDDQDPELLNQLYVHTTDDLSYSRTFYPNRSVRVYLNGLAQRTFLQIYRGRRGEAGRFFSFWSEELPLTVYRYRRSLLVALLVFVFAMGVGVLSYMIDPDFARVIMGDAYMDMTEENIANGDPMAVYKKTSPLSMSLRITANNIQVAFMTFVSGAFFAVGSVVQLIRNGVMLGVFQYFFFAQGGTAVIMLPEGMQTAVDWLSPLFGGEITEAVFYALYSMLGTGSVFRESLLTVWIHGALEISSIVIAGGAGIAMGSGLLFPGTLSRFQAFGRSARAGLKIMLGTVPLFIVAGFLEGFVTRHTELPDWLRLLFILACFAFIIWYYVSYPRRVAARVEQAGGQGEAFGVAKRRAAEADRFESTEIRTSGEIMTLGVRLLRLNLGQILGALALLSLVFVGYSFIFRPAGVVDRYFFDSDFYVGDLINAYSLYGSFGMGRSVFYLLLVAAGFTGLLLLSYRTVARAAGEPAGWPAWTNLGAVAGVAFLLALIFAFGGVGASLLFLFTFPFLLTYGYACYLGRFPPGPVLKSVYTHLALSYSNFFLFLVLAIPCMWLLDSSIGSLIFTFFDWVFYADEATLSAANVVLQAGIYYFLYGIVIVLWTVCLSVGYYSLREIDGAGALSARIKEVGRGMRIRGMEVES